MSKKAKVGATETVGDHLDGLQPSYAPYPVREPTPEEIEEIQRQNTRSLHKQLWFQYSVIGMQVCKMQTMMKADTEFPKDADVIKATKMVAQAAARLADAMLLEYMNRE